MDYTEVKFVCQPYEEATKDVLAALAAEIGFESFVDAESGVTAYIPSKLFDEAALERLIEEFPLNTELSYQFQEIEGQNWNEEWEKNYFQPLIIDDRCIVQSSFHNAPRTFEYNIIIDPKMAFGTGHHQTTELMIRSILQEELSGKSLLDMGCGTAILAILASMRGADPILAIDIDEWAYDNAVENLGLNNIQNINVLIGGAELLANQIFDVILANINRNILLNDISRYVDVLNKGGRLFLSGFYLEDIPAILAECQKQGLAYVSHAEKDNWVAVKFQKN
ncbi:MAG: prmA [Bacteroidetes bacterium]|nr:prmA [Bacteroidota bacterium]